MTDLTSKIQNLGKRLVKCQNNCSGISLDMKRGIIPRCLIVEHRDRTESKGAAVVGINPGQADDSEREFYKNHKCTYDSVCQYWENKGLKDIPYYSYLRDFVDCLGFSGPILWTELVKCQNKDKGELLPLQTFRNCTRSYLNEELKEINSNWPLIAAGKEVYKALAYLYPKRALIGVPHPNSRGQFHSLFQKGSDRKKFSKHIENLVDEFKNNWGTATWLTKSRHWEI